MKKPNQDDEPFFITEEIAAEMIAGGYEFELPPIPCTIGHWLAMSSNGRHFG
ncbi:hypothetical protein [Escherichia coli]|uniref:hypothetical protein n=1 Tax=Escherichia coli TaxID=562 RepID=UPI000A68295B|nr:hypothetical protein [Escherichia coli]